MIGFSISSLFVQQDQPWQYAFYLQSALLVPVVLTFASIPSRYFELENANKLKIKIQQEFLEKLLRYLEKDDNSKKLIPDTMRDTYQKEIDDFGIMVEQNCEKLLEDQNIERR